MNFSDVIPSSCAHSHDVEAGLRSTVVETINPLDAWVGLVHIQHVIEYPTQRYKGQILYLVFRARPVYLHLYAMNRPKMDGRIDG